MPSQEQIQQRIERFPGMCREAGLKVTPQRSAVYAMLAGAEHHPSPEEVYGALRKTYPSISLATVYKILDLFQARGYVRRVSSLEKVRRYDARTEPHHHAICSACGKIQDVSAEALGLSTPSIPRSLGFAVEGFEILFHGLCESCGG